ncbi:MAG: dephospho-CoA kinase [Desulfobacteraceae bacterium]|nr:dephospho-CoA kinase [Desulfobacteraceae bacterium]
MPVLLAGLTGGIASGKSTVSQMLARLGAQIIDADVIARQVVAPGLEAWKGIVNVFGEDILQPDGYIDRKMLGQMVFNDIALRRQLENIIHPFVREKIASDTKRVASESPNALIIQDIPLLLENDLNRGLDEVIVVYIPEALQLQRLMARDGLAQKQALARIRSQMPLKKKRRMATVIIDNSGKLHNTLLQVRNVYRLLSNKAKCGQ